MSVERDKNEKTIKIGQHQYILDMLERYGMTACKPVSTPIVIGGLVEGDALKATDGPFQSLVGSLLYASTSTRPDITMVVSHLSIFTTIATSMH